MRTITIVGAGPGNPDLLTRAAHEALGAADVVVGARRLVEAEGLVCLFANARTAVATRAADVAAALAQTDGWQHAVILMSGDTGLFSGAGGAASAIAGEPGLADCAVDVIPGISSASLLAARLGRPWQVWRFVTAHGTACDIAAEATRGGTVFLVTSGAAGPGELCGRLVACGRGEVSVTVAERLSYPEERIVHGTAAELAGRTFDPLNVMLVDFDAAPSAPDRWPWATGGIPDGLFERGRVPMTKQEVRSVALAKLRIAATDTVYDIGAGTGSVAVECGLAARAGRVFAIEHAPEAAELCQRNVDAFGLANVQVVAGEAPVALADLPAPDAVFIGGSAGRLEGILDSLRAKRSSCRICLTVVSLETLAAATSAFAASDIEDVAVCQVSVARAEAVGAHHLMRAQNPIFIVTARMVGGDAS